MRSLIAPLAAPRMSLPHRSTARTRISYEVPKRSLGSVPGCATTLIAKGMPAPAPVLVGATAPSDEEPPPPTVGPTTSPGRAATRLQPSQWNSDSLTQFIASSPASDVIALAFT